jgi:hypothetical protein
MDGGNFLVNFAHPGDCSGDGLIYVVYDLGRLLVQPPVDILLLLYP